MVFIDLNEMFCIVLEASRGFQKPVPHLFASGKRGGGRGSCGVLPEQSVADAYLRVRVERAASYPVTQSFRKRKLIRFSNELFSML